MGDGLVPLESALIAGSKKIILEKTCHGGLFGKYWYGSKERIEIWWNELEYLFYN